MHEVNLQELIFTNAKFSSKLEKKIEKEPEEVIREQLADDQDGELTCRRIVQTIFKLTKFLKIWPPTRQLNKLLSIKKQLMIKLLETWKFSWKWKRKRATRIWEKSKNVRIMTKKNWVIIM